jgi:hypothetical protein
MRREALALLERQRTAKGLADSVPDELRPIP